MRHSSSSRHNVTPGVRLLEADGAGDVGLSDEAGDVSAGHLANEKRELWAMTNEKRALPVRDWRHPPPGPGTFSEDQAYSGESLNTELFTCSLRLGPPQQRWTPCAPWVKRLIFIENTGDSTDL